MQTLLFKQGLTQWWLSHDTNINTERLVFESCQVWSGLGVLSELCASSLAFLNFDFGQDQKEEDNCKSDHFKLTMFCIRASKIEEKQLREAELST